MNRRSVIALLAGAAAQIAVAGTALAQTVGDQVVGELRRLGYSQISVSRTLLGRLRIVALLDGTRREIILNPTSGEILRDLVTDEGTGQATSGLLSKNDTTGHGSRDGDNEGSGSSGGGGDDGGNDGGSGSGGDDGDDDSGSGGGDDDSGSGSDDDDDDDSSGSGGSGSGGSGSGSGGSGGGGDDDDEGDDGDDGDDD